ncbi:YeeE/YedE thiosulfate transporter family protein [Dyella sp. KULCS107]|uniref:YeeE/YedE thiosulfate transporter family protein n=1 Tax=Dyella sp. KULCS107 TaxID=3422216 RepID=UPI003D6E7BD4
MKQRPIWNAHVAGAVLGLVLLLTFVLTGHGLGASGAPTAIAAATSNVVAPSATEANGYLGWMVENGRNPLDTWIIWEVVGVTIGALAAAWWSGRLHLRVEGPPRARAPGRLALALTGGIVSGFGARVAAGCTSGLGLSGSATLATAGFVFLIGFFGAGLATGLLTRGMWK